MLRKINRLIWFGYFWAGFYAAGCLFNAWVAAHFHRPGSYAFAFVSFGAGLMMVDSVVKLRRARRAIQNPPER